MVVVVSGTVEVVIDVVVVDGSGMVGSGANDVLVSTEEVVVDSTVVVTASVVVDTSVVVVVAVNSHNDRLLIVRCPGAQQVSIEY